MVQEVKKGSRQLKNVPNVLQPGGGSIPKAIATNSLVDGQPMVEMHR